MIDSRKSRLATLATCLALGFGGLGVAGCGDDDEGPAEEAGQALDEAGEDVGEAGEEAGQELEQAGEEAGEALDEAGEGADDPTEEKEGGSY